MNTENNKALRSQFPPVGDPLPHSVREEFERWAEPYWAQGLDAEWMPEYEAYVDETLQSSWSAYKAANSAQQAEIDRLMLEFCPDEMTEQQIKTWGDSQRRCEE